jgi:uncharacterized protein YdhG (YjbR/CyaY superfamily)
MRTKLLCPPVPTRRTTRKPTKKTATRQTVEDYLAAQPKSARAALTKLRKAIKAVVPTATDVISYGVPTFKYDGKGLVAYGAATAHCTFYLMSTGVLRAHAAKLKNYDLGKGSIQFSANKPLPPSLVTTLVKARIAENKTRSYR